MNQRHTSHGRQLCFHGVLSFINRVFDRDLDFLSHFHFSIIDSRFQPVDLSTHWLYSWPLTTITDGKSWSPIPHFQWPKMTSCPVPLGIDSMAPQHSTPNIGGDTFRDNSAKNKSTYRILVTQNLSVVSKMELFISSSRNKTISVVPLFKLQPNPINARLALTCGCMANGSHAVRIVPLI